MNVWGLTSEAIKQISILSFLSYFLRQLFFFWTQCAKNAENSIMIVLLKYNDNNYNNTNLLNGLQSQTSYIHKVLCFYIR